MTRETKPISYSKLPPLVDCKDHSCERGEAGHGGFVGSPYDLYKFILLSFFLKKVSVIK